MSYLGDFCTRMASRYEAKSQPIHYWELYNEANFQHATGATTTATGTYGANTITVADATNIFIGYGLKGTGLSNTIDVKVVSISGLVITLSANNVGTVSGTIIMYSYFFGGSVGALAQIAKAVNQAVKAVMPTAKIVSPSVTNLMNETVPPSSSNVATTYFTAMMNASDGDTGKLSDWVDVVAIHTYLNNNASLPTAISAVKTIMSSLGISAKPLMNTEQGYAVSTAESDFNLYKDMIRQVVINASLGLSGTSYYQLGKVGANSDGYSLGLRTAMMVSIVAIFNKILTYGIDSAAMLPDGSVAFTVNGINYIV
jgi:hypothetical protein